MGSGVWVGTLASGLASALAQNDEGERAEVLLDELAASRPPRAAAAEAVLRTRGEVALLRGVPELALAIADEVLALNAQRDGPPVVMPRTLSSRRSAGRARTPREGRPALEQARGGGRASSPAAPAIAVDAGAGTAPAGAASRGRGGCRRWASARVVDELVDEIADDLCGRFFLRVLPARLRQLGRSPTRGAKRRFGGLAETRARGRGRRRRRCVRRRVPR